MHPQLHDRPAEGDRSTVIQDRHRRPSRLPRARSRARRNRAPSIPLLPPCCRHSGSGSSSARPPRAPTRRPNRDHRMPLSRPFSSFEMRVWSMPDSHSNSFCVMPSWRRRRLTRRPSAANPCEVRSSSQSSRKVSPTHPGMVASVPHRALMEPASAGHLRASARGHAAGVRELLPNMQPRCMGFSGHAPRRGRAYRPARGGAGAPRPQVVASLG